MLTATAIKARKKRRTVKAFAKKAVREKALRKTCDENMGIIRAGKTGWKMDLVKGQKLVDAIGEVIKLYYE